MELVEELAQALRDAGDSSDRARELARQIGRFAEVVAPWAARMNLTGPRNPETIAKELLLPPVLWSRLLPVSPQTIVDIGSGAGIPGIPLAMRFPEARTLLVESRERRHHFQRHAVRELGFPRVEPVLGRAETLEAVAGDLAVAQALAPLREAVFHVKRWTRVGGIIAIPQRQAAGPIENANAEARPVETRDGARPPTDLGAALKWLGCPEYPDPFGGRPGFLWISKRIR